MSINKLLFGIDLGGTKIRIVVLDATRNNRKICDIRVKTHQEKGYQGIIEQIATLVKRAAKKVKADPTMIGIGTPGTLDKKTKRMRGCNTQCLNGKPLKADLEKRLGIPVIIENDANCFALAEARLGAGKGKKVVFGVIMGTGTGAGVVVNGELISGRQGIAGEWGHNVVEVPGTPCYCGKSGCVETVISGGGLEKHYQELKHLKRKVSLKTIYKRAKAGETEAKQLLDRLTEYFARSIGVVINILDPDVIVLGGGVSEIPELHTKGIRRAKKFTFNPKPDNKIVKNKLGNSSGVFGAAMLVA